MIFLSLFYDLCVASLWGFNHRVHPASSGPAHSSRSINVCRRLDLILLMILWAGSRMRHSGQIQELSANNQKLRQGDDEFLLGETRETENCGWRTIHYERPQRERAGKRVKRPQSRVITAIGPPRPAELSSRDRDDHREGPGHQKDIIELGSICKLSYKFTSLYKQLFPGMFIQMVQIMKLWPKDKNVTYGQGHRAAWVIAQRAGILPVTLGHSFSGLTSLQLKGEVRTSLLGSLACGLGRQLSRKFKWLRPNCLCYRSMDERFGKNKL